MTTPHKCTHCFRITFVVAMISLLAVLPGWAGGKVLYTDVTKPDIAPDYLIIAPRAAVPALHDLVLFRSRSMSMRIGEAEAIYKSYLKADSDDARPKDKSRALRAFIEVVRQRGGSQQEDVGKGLRFVLLVGTGNVKDKAGLYLPTCIQPVAFKGNAGALGGYSSDAAGDFPYSLPVGKDVPDIAIGRFPARSLAELKQMAANTLAAEKARKPGAWRRQVCLFAGQGNFGKQVDQVLEQMTTGVLAHGVGNHIDVHMAYANPGSLYCVAPSRFADHVLAQAKHGPAMLMYIGHGSLKGFDSFRWKGQRYPIMGEDAIAKIDVPDNRTAMFSIACWNGRFDGHSASIGERLVASPKGPAAFFASSRISHPYGNAILGGYLVEVMMNDPQPTLGETLLKVRQAIAEGRQSRLRFMLDMAAAAFLGGQDMSGQFVDHNVMYNLLGDPALSTPLVPGAIKLDAPASAKAGETIQITLPETTLKHATVWLSIRRDCLGKPLQPVSTRDADAESKMTALNAEANDKTILSMDVDLAGGDKVTRVSLKLPTTIPARVCFINVYAWDEKQDAAGTRAISIHR